MGGFDWPWTLTGCYGRQVLAVVRPLILVNHSLTVWFIINTPVSDKSIPI